MYFIIFKINRDVDTRDFNDLDSALKALYEMLRDGVKNACVVRKRDNAVMVSVKNGISI